MADVQFGGGIQPQWHTFQGQSAGPEHAIPCIIIQPGTLKMERLCPGLLYMFISRGTTIGTPEDISSSAIFFSQQMN